MSPRLPPTLQPFVFADHEHGSARAALLPVLVWLNRRELASRFPGWRDAPSASAATSLGRGAGST